MNPICVFCVNLVKEAEKEGKKVERKGPFLYVDGKQVAYRMYKPEGCEC